MKIKNHLLLSMLLMASACGKKESASAAKSYFKMAFAELSQDGHDRNTQQRALSYVNQALALNPRPEYHAFKGTVLFKLGDLVHGKESFQAALHQNPAEQLRGEIMNNYACLLAQEGEGKRAIAIWQSLLHDTAYQTPEVALVNLGKLHMQQGDALQAQAVFQQAVHCAPSYVDAHFYLAMAAQRCKEYALARHELTTVLYLEPMHLDAQAMMRTLSIDL